MSYLHFGWGIFLILAILIPIIIGHDLCGMSQTVSRFPHKLYKSDFTVFVCLSARMKTRSGNISEKSQTELMYYSSRFVSLNVFSLIYY